MSITTNSSFKAAPRISKAAWLNEIEIAYPTPLFNGIPTEDRPDVASGMYDFIVRSQHDPLTWLAVGWCEHRLGTDDDSVLHRNDTRSLTNARTVRDPSLSGYVTVRDAKRRSNYVKYQSVVDSLQDGIYRVDEPGYNYRQANAVSIIDHTMIWTEGDGPQYAAKMAAYMNRVIAEDTGGAPMATPYDHIIPGMIDVRSQLATATPNQGGVQRGPYETIPLSAKRGVVVHYRGVVTDVNAGLASYKADATYHVGKNWARRGEAPILGSGIMYHIGIDGQGTVYLLRDLNRVLWHCGAWPQNENTLAIQLPLGGNQRATEAQLTALTRVVDAWLTFTKAPDSEVWGHQELSATDCPGTLMTDFVKPYRNAPPVDEPLFFPETGKTLGGGFKQFWLAKGGLAIFGYPITEEMAEDGLTVQWFERARFEHRPNSNPALWDVMLGLIGVELLEARTA